MRNLTQSVNPPGLALGILVLAAVGAVLLGNAIVNEDYHALAVILAFGVGGFFTIFIFRDWRLGVVLFFVWAVFEDMLRKFLGNNMMVYFTKDLIIVAAYASFFLAMAQRREKTWVNPIRVPLLLFAAWVAIEGLNPYLDNFLVPLLGLRMSLFYIPLLYLGYSFPKREQHLRNFWFLMLGIAALISSLGIIQSLVGLDFLNPEFAPNLRLYLVRVAPGSGAEVPRPTATFADAGRFAQYMLVMAFVGLAVVAYFHQAAGMTRRVVRLLAWGCWSLILVGLFLSGGRASVLWIVLSLTFMLFLKLFIADPARSVGKFPLHRLLLAAAAVLVISAVLAPERFSSALLFYTETMDPSSQYSEVVKRPQSYFKDTLYAWEQSSWLGHGTGSASLGLQYVAPLLSEQEAYKFRSQVEGGYAAVLWEWGIVGLVLWLWWSLLLLKAMFETTRKLRGTRFFWLASTIAICIFAILFPTFFMGVQIYQNYLTQAFLWFLIGMLFRLPQFSTAGPDRALVQGPTGQRRLVRPWFGAAPQSPVMRWR